MKSLTVELKISAEYTQAFNTPPRSHVSNDGLDRWNSIIESNRHKEQLLKQFVEENPGLKSEGYIFYRENKFFQYVFSENILNYIKTNFTLINNVDWSGLFEDKSDIQSSIVKLHITKDDIGKIAPFDNESFWKYATRAIKDMDCDFIHTYTSKINFSYDRPALMYAIQTREYFRVPSNLSLSQSTALLWSVEFISQFKEHWNWSFLSSNPAVPWDEVMIEAFFNYIDFDSISDNRNLPWSVELIEKYKLQWNWQILSANPSLPWGLEILKKYKENWYWKSDDISLKYLRGTSYSSLKPRSISHNNGIFWDYTLREFIPLIDIWSIAANAKMSQLFISIVAPQLNETRLVYTYWRKYSDYPLEEEDVIYSGWELIQMNRNTFYSS
jgi:hypothetical protein